MEICTQKSGVNKTSLLFLLSCHALQQRLITACMLMFAMLVYIEAHSDLENRLKLAKTASNDAASC